MLLDFFKNVRLILVVLIVISETYAQHLPKTGDDFKIDLKTEQNTVATVGSIIISEEEFKLNYDFGPAFLKGKKILKSVISISC